MSVKAKLPADERTDAEQVSLSMAASIARGVEQLDRGESFTTAEVRERLATARARRA